MNNLYVQKKSVQTRNGSIVYFCSGSFSGRPATILLHGLSSNHTTWLNTMEILFKNRYNSVALDIRGHGFSDKTKNRNLYRWEVFSDDLNRVIEKEGIKNFILVGYSFGGQIAIDYALRHPEFVRGLVLISVNHARPLAYRGLGFLTPVVSGLLNVLALIVLWQKRKNYHYYEHGKAVGYWDSVWDGLRTMPLSINFWMLRETVNVNFKNSIERIKIPAVILYGQNDAFITKKEINDMVSAMKNAAAIVSQNPNHFVGTNSQDETNQIILDFLKQYENSDF